ncbi:MAG TPA: aminopeptidase, partial [Micavibrio sp.]
AIAGLENDPAFREDVQQKAPKMWKDFTAPPADIALQHALAKKLYNATPGSNDVVYIQLGDYAKEIGPWLVDRCLGDKIPFMTEIQDPAFEALSLNASSMEAVKKTGQALVAMTQDVNKRITARSGLPETEPLQIEPTRSNLYTQTTSPFKGGGMTGKIFYTLTVLPTRKDAETDAMDYNDYVKLFFEMCDQPWDAIGQAQQSLIEEFNAATKVHITNNDGTDISMELVDHDDSHFTFCNSLIAKNVPGSEIFSAPRRDSVNGTIVAKGRFSDHGAEIVEDLTLVFNQGRLIDYKAAKGLDSFERSINIDDGARYVGELGIGTNPHLKRHVVNGLLVEKIGGSFHIALGAPYSYTNYMGTPVKVNNGGKSLMHWDITTILNGRGGKIELDDRAIMKEGQWLDSKYDVLNRGWESIPEEQRPEYWKDYYKNKPEPGP